MFAVPVIAVSASVMPEDRRGIVNSGFDAYMTKPIALKTLRATVERFLTGGRRDECAHPGRRRCGRELRLLADVLGARGYRTSTAASGEEALARIAADMPDLVLLDVMMPGMSGYDVCRAIRADPACAVLPVVLVTALDPEHERVKGLEAGADDFLSKPIHQAELMARVRSLLRVKALYDEVQRQRAELQAWNSTLEQRVADAARQIERVGQLKRFFSPQLAEAILAGGADDPLKSHRREITVVFLDLRGTPPSPRPPIRRR